jgi:hypothetical protein
MTFERKRVLVVCYSSVIGRRFFWMKKIRKRFAPLFVAPLRFLSKFAIGVRANPFQQTESLSSIHLVPYFCKVVDPFGGGILVC